MWYWFLLMQSLDLNIPEVCPKKIKLTPVASTNPGRRSNADLKVLLN